jgi:hypothetical protein
MYDERVLCYVTLRVETSAHTTTQVLNILNSLDGSQGPTQTEGRQIGLHRLCPVTL